MSDMTQQACSLEKCLFCVENYRTTEDKLKSAIILVFVLVLGGCIIFSFRDSIATDGFAAVTFFVSLFAMVFSLFICLPRIFDRKKSIAMTGIEFQHDYVSRKSVELSLSDKGTYNGKLPTTVTACTVKNTHEIIPLHRQIPALFIKIQQGIEGCDNPSYFHISEIGTITEGKSAVAIPTRKQMCVIQNGQALRLHDADFDVNSQYGEKILHQLQKIGEMLSGTPWLNGAGKVVVFLEPQKAGRSPGLLFAGGAILEGIVRAVVDSANRKQLAEQLQSGLFINAKYGNELLTLINGFGWQIEIGKG